MASVFFEVLKPEIDEMIETAVEAAVKDAVKETEKSTMDYAYTTMAERMIADGMSGDKISLFTALDREKIDSIARRLNRSVRWDEAGA